MQVGLERDDFCVLLQHRVRVELLIGFFGLDIDVDAVGHDVAGLPVLRLVAYRMELEPHLEMCPCIDAVRVQMDGTRHEG